MQSYQSSKTPFFHNRWDKIYCHLLNLLRAGPLEDDRVLDQLHYPLLGEGVLDLKEDDLGMT
jgi:hypothetical protein